MRTAVAALLFAAMLGCTQFSGTDTPQGTSGPSTPTTPSAYTTPVFFSTDDGFTLHGTLYRPGNPNNALVVLVHMLNLDRASWKTIPDELTARGYTVLALDARGHGESAQRNGEYEDWQEFSESDFQKMPTDVLQALALERYVPADALGAAGVPSRAYLIGASIGANTVLAAAASADIAGVVALSPGRVYRGLSAEEPATTYTGPIFFVASEEDTYAASSTRTLFEASLSKNKQLHMYDGAGHGTGMLNGTDLKERIFSFLAEN